MATQYRQGDLLFERMLANSNRSARSETTDIIERGELTGHAHRLVGGTVYNNGAVVRAEPGARVVHEEHDTIELPEGWYRVIRQREFSEGGERTVRD